MFPYEIDDFKLVDNLGKQKSRKFNQTFLVLHKTKQLYGVLKIIFKKEASRTSLHEQLKLETRSTDTSGPIPPTYAFKETADEIQFIKKYIPGTTLQEFLDTHRKFDRLFFVQNLLKELEQTMNQLKTQNIVHCDINPSNIILADIQKMESGKFSFKAHLIDYGLMQYENEYTQKPLVFSLLYSAPELILKRHQLVKNHSDYYSLGIVSYKILTGESPYTHSNPAVLTNIALNIPLPKIKKFSSELNEILQRMTSKPQFRNAPHYLSEEEIDAGILQAQKNRYPDFTQIVSAISSIKYKKLSFFAIKIKIFSKPNIKIKN